MATRAPIRITIAASVCVISSAGLGAAHSVEAGQDNKTVADKWDAIKDAFKRGDLTITGSGSEAIKGQVEAQFRNPAGPFGNGAIVAECQVIADGSLGQTIDG
jgi:hypothetical protein